MGRPETPQHYEAERKHQVNKKIRLRGNAKIWNEVEKQNRDNAVNDLGVKYY